ncbi:MAG: hypothetical protein ABSG59_16060 [Verrucomicrobiota bacterium]|jgi:predicted  nucleic acid-binding Zn-ribbon protein
MKIRLTVLVLAAFCGPPCLCAQNLHSKGDYPADVATVRQAQEQALDQARQMLGQIDDPAKRRDIETAVKDMERADAALDQAGKNPEKLAAAVAAEEAAYQALLKVVPREFRVSRSRSGSRSGRAGQPSRQQMNQLEMTSEEDRYENERQAAAAPNEQQREKLQIADRLKQLAQRQQDLNDRLQELQTALSEARTDGQREDLQRQIKRLSDDQRQMLSDLDELRQSLDQSPNAGSLEQARQQLERTRSDSERAVQELDRQSVSQALAAGSRAQQGMRNLREDLRKQTSSQFSDQMRQLRAQARDLSRQENDVDRGLDSMANADHKSLDDSAQRQELIQKMSRQESALTNLLATMENVSEQAETTEPLLSEQLYDTLRRASQMHTDNLLESAGQLLDHDLVSQAGGVERSARQNLDELRQRVERAAESVLGNESDALRYAQTELDALSKQVEREVTGADTNANPSAAATAGATSAAATNGAATDPLRQALRQFAANSTNNARGRDGGPITGNNFTEWSDRAREVEQVLDDPALRNLLGTARERVAAYRTEYRLRGSKPDTAKVRVQVLDPINEVRTRLQEQLSRLANGNSLVPLDHDPVPDNYSEMVRKYYEKLGGGQ